LRDYSACNKARLEFSTIFVPSFDPNEWCLKNGLRSGGLNPGPLGHESSALTTRPRLLAYLPCLFVEALFGLKPVLRAPTWDKQVLSCFVYAFVFSFFSLVYFFVYSFVYSYVCFITVIVDANTQCHNAVFSVGSSTTTSRYWSIKVRIGLDRLAKVRLG
jgi:hypothetical protein